MLSVKLSSMLLAVMVVTSAVATDYCSSTTCPGGIHTMCLYPTDGPTEGLQPGHVGEMWGKDHWASWQHPGKGKLLRKSDIWSLETLGLGHRGGLWEKGQVR